MGLYVKRTVILTCMCGKSEQFQFDKETNKPTIYTFVSFELFEF